MDNLVEPVTKELDFQLQTPFLLYRNHAGDIYGIWFYEQVSPVMFMFKGEFKMYPIRLNARGLGKGLSC